jgi:thiosulfate dehydrogenase (quinone) large subunit
MPKRKNKLTADKMWGLSRIGIGFVLFWAFLDKAFGLGFTTCKDQATNAVNVMCDAAWFAGGSPTTGFLQFGTSGPFANIYQGLAGNGLVDWLFMLGLLGIGAALILGIGMRIATFAGILLFLMMWSATFPPTNNPLISDHIIYSLVLIGLLKVNDKQELGFGKQWKKSKLVKKYPILR